MMDQVTRPNTEVIAFKSDFSLEIKALILSSSQSKKFQSKMIIFFMFASLFSNLQLCSSKFLYMNPSFECQGADSKQTEEYACRNIEFCSIINTGTITAQLNLFCDERIDDRIMIQSFTGIGNWIGICFAFIISDRKGRKFCLCLTLIILNIGCVIQYLGFKLSLPMLLAISEIFLGFAGKTIYVNFLILSTRFLGKEDYENVTVGWLIIGAGAAEIVIALLVSFQPDWRILFYIYTVGIVAISALSFFMIHEDPIFYFDKGRYEQCKAVVESIGLENGESEEMISGKMKQIDSYIAFKDNYDNYEHIDCNYFSYGELIRSDILLNVLILGFVGCCYNFSTSSIDLSIQSMHLSYSQNIFIIGIANIIGYITAIYIIRIEDKRKRGFLFSSVLCGIAGAMFAFPFCVESEVVQSIGIIILRISLCWISNFYVRLKVDLFPEKYQATLIGLIEFITNLGKIFCPLLVQISTDHRLNVIFSINLIHITIGTLPILFLIESKITLLHFEEADPAVINKGNC